MEALYIKIILLNQKAGEDSHNMAVEGTMPQEIIEHLLMHLLDPDQADNPFARALRNFVIKLTGSVPTLMTPEEIEKHFGKETLDQMERENLKKKSTGGD